MSSRRYSFVLLGAMLSPLACRQPDRSLQAAEPASPASAATRAAIPAKARLPVKAVFPSLSAPSDAPGADDVPRTAREALARGEEHLGKGDYGRAVPQFEKARRAAPDSARIRRGLGLSYAGLGDPVKAEAELRASTEKAPDHVRVQLLLGRYALTRGEFDLAARRFRLAVLCSDAAGDNPHAAEALLRLAALLENQGYWTAALSCYEELSERLLEHGRKLAARPALKLLVARPERVLTARGRLHLKLGRVERAAVLLERAYRRDKTYNEAARLVLKALIASGRFRRAEAVIMELLDEPAQRPLAIEGALGLCRVQKDPAVPRRLLKAYMDRGGSDSAFVIAMARAAADLGAAEDATGILSRHLSGSPEDTRAALELARLHMRRGELTTAAARYAELLAADAIDLQQLRAELARAGRRSIAKEAIEKLPATADEKVPRLAPAMLCVSGLLADAAGHGDLAVRLLRRAVKNHPRFWGAYEALVELLSDRGDDEGLDDLAEQITRSAGETYLKSYLLGRIYLAQGKVDRAVESLEESRSRRGGHVPTLRLLGRAYAAQGNVRDAERRLLAGLALDPDNAEVAEELFELYVQRRRFSEGGRMVLRFLRDNPRSVRGRLLAARHYLLTGKRDKARRMLRQLRAEAADNVEVRLLEVQIDLPESLTDEKMARARAEAVLAKLRGILRLAPRNERAWSLIAAVLGNQGRHEEAARALERLCRRRPNDAVLAGAYLNALIKAGQRAEAAGAVERLVGRKRLDARMRLMVLDALLEIERAGRAAELIGAWLEDPTDNTELYRLRLRALKVYEAAGQHDKGVKLVDDWLASGLEEDKATILWLKATKLRFMVLDGRLDDADAYAGGFTAEEWRPHHPKEIFVEVLVEGKAYEKAHAVLREWAAAPGADGEKIREVRGWILAAYAREKKYDALLKYGRRWIRREPLAVDLPRVAVLLLSRAEQHEQALKLAEEWLAAIGKASPTTAPADEDPSSAAKATIVTVLLQAEKDARALARARQFAKGAPKDPEVLRVLLAALHANDREDEYLALMERIFELDPDDPGINNDLGYSWADRGIHLERAEFMIRKALAARPDTIAFKDSLGWVLYKQGKFEAARRIFDQTVTAEEELLHAVILDHAGDTLWRLGRTERAVALWKRALALARKDESPDRETRGVLRGAAAKIKAAEAGKAPPVAPLGKGVPEPE